MASCLIAPPLLSYRKPVHLLMLDLAPLPCRTARLRARTSQPRRRSSVINMHETDGAIAIVAELPGVPKELISISIDRDHLTISVDNTRKKDTNPNVPTAQRKHNADATSEHHGPDAVRMQTAPSGMDADSDNEQAAAPTDHDNAAQHGSNSADLTSIPGAAVAEGTDTPEFVVVTADGNGNGAAGKEGEEGATGPRSTGDAACNVGAGKEGAASDSKQEQKTWHAHERQQVFSEQSIKLPAHLDCDRATADYSAGVLTITLPKQPQEERRKRIAVQ